MESSCFRSSIFNGLETHCLQSIYLMLIQVDIQALAHAVELTRQGAVDSLRFAKGDLFQAFQVFFPPYKKINNSLFLSLSL